MHSALQLSFALQAKAHLAPGGQTQSWPDRQRSVIVVAESLPLASCFVPESTPPESAPPDEELEDDEAPPDDELEDDEAPPEDEDDDATQLACTSRSFNAFWQLPGSCVPSAFSQACLMVGLVQ